MFRSLTTVVCGVLLTAAAGAYVLHSSWHQPLQLQSEGAVLTIEPGESLHQILQGLAQQDWITGVRWVSLVARGLGVDKQIKAGEFAVEPQMALSDLLMRLAKGEVLQYSVTFPEGITLPEALVLLHGHPKLAKTPPAGLASSLREMSAYHDRNERSGVNLIANSAEGWFLPETWSFTAGDHDVDILTRAHDAMQALLAELWEQRDLNTPLNTPYEALILASIVEKETGVPSERQQIAGVFLRRLLKGMRLQTDPTVIYGLGDRYDGNLRRAHLRDKTNPYNTYVISGLPPTPIALPGEAALRAVFLPDRSDALYFVAKGDGTHAFSHSLAEHEEAVRRYQLSRRSDYQSSPRTPSSLEH